MAERRCGECGEPSGGAARCPEHGEGYWKPRESAPKHTPGPWKAFIDKKRGAKIVATSEVSQVAFVGCDRTGPTDEDPDERMSADAQANARLIAAAPEMAEALERLDGWLASSGYDAEHPWRVSICATLKKAGVLS
jgi:hypothetical protein